MKNLIKISSILSVFSFFSMVNSSIQYINYTNYDISFDINFKLIYSDPIKKNIVLKKSGVPSTISEDFPFASSIEIKLNSPQSFEYKPNRLILPKQT